MSFKKQGSMQRETKEITIGEEIDVPMESSWRYASVSKEKQWHQKP